MKSVDISDLTMWRPWPTSALAEAPKTPGLYVFRLCGDKCVGRVRGESDIVYIGTTKKGKGTVRSRLRGHQLAGADDRHRLKRISEEVGRLEVGWKTFAKHFDAQWLESTLLSRYAVDHIELPPANRQQSLKASQDFLHYLGKCSPEDQNKVLKAARALVPPK